MIVNRKDVRALTFQNLPQHLPPHVPQERDLERDSLSNSTDMHERQAKMHERQANFKNTPERQEVMRVGQEAEVGTEEGGGGGGGGDFFACKTHEVETLTKTKVMRRETEELCETEELWEVLASEAEHARCIDASGLDSL